MPKGYILAEVDVTDPTAYEGYRSRVMPTVEAFGGVMLVRGGDPQPLEGSPAAKRVVILEFASPERAMEWYNSPAYQAILPIRLQNSVGRVHCLTGA